MCSVGLIGPVLDFCSFGVCFVLLGSVLVLLGLNSISFRVLILFMFLVL